MPTKTFDPQLVVTGHIKDNGDNGELFIFSIPLGKYFELVCICNLPGPDETEASVYVKHKIRFASPRPQGATEEKDVRNEDDKKTDAG